jgi:N-acetylmuramoyl-L-alanine amidase
MRYEWHPSPNYSTPQYHDQIGLHTSEGATSNPNLAHWLCQSASQVSYHFSVDNVTAGLAYQYVDTSKKSWAQAAYNPNGITACFCTPSGASSGWSRDYWLNTQMRAIENMAAVVGDMSRKYGIPLVALTSSQAQSGARGVCQHFNYGPAGSNHTDCGNGFPMDVLIQLAKGQAPAPPKPKLLDQEDLSMLIEFGSDNKANIPLPNNVISLRLVCAQGGTVVVRWMETGKSERRTLTETTRWDYTIPSDQKGFAQIEDEGLQGPLYVTWIQKAQ